VGGERNGDGSGRKCDDDRGGSPAWMRGGKRRGACDARVVVGGGELGGGGEEKKARPAPFEAEAGEAREGWRSEVRRRVEEKTGQREGAGVR
jgi:hypothetical protein